jgi:hypothetical protein
MKLDKATCEIAFLRAVCKQAIFEGYIATINRMTYSACNREDYDEVVKQFEEMYTQHEITKYFDTLFTQDESK